MALQLQEFTSLIGQSGEQVNDIYEADYRDFNRETDMRGRKTFYTIWAEFKKLLYGIWRRDELAKDAPRGEPRMFRARNICRIAPHKLPCGAVAKSSPRGPEPALAGGAPLRPPLPQHHSPPARRCCVGPFAAAPSPITRLVEASHAEASLGEVSGPWSAPGPRGG
ncbi:hypothetical protein MASR2M74_37500 [Paracoccaceae bacterium]